MPPSSTPPKPRSRRSPSNSPTCAAALRRQERSAERRNSATCSRKPWKPTSPPAKRKPNKAVPEAKRPREARARRPPAPALASLPRIEHRHEPESCTCGQCGKDLVKIGEDVSEQLDVEPARILRHPPHPPAIRLPRLRHHHCRPDPGRNHRRRPGRTGLCWPGWRSANTPTTCPCTGSNRSPRARASSCRVPPWRNGWDASAWPSPRWRIGWPNAQAIPRPARRRNPGGATRSRGRQDQTGLSVGVSQQRLAAGPPIVVFDYQAAVRAAMPVTSWQAGRAI
jgi:hypothetical protein